MRPSLPSFLPRLTSFALLGLAPLLLAPTSTRADTFGFINEFDIGGWSFASGGTGSSFSGSATTLTLNGSQNADNVVTQATYSTNVSGLYTISFDFAYVTTDTGGPQWDPAGFLTESPTPLSDSFGPDTQTGTVSNLLFTGGTFGFFASSDNYSNLASDGFGTLTITNFSFAPAVLPVWTGAAGSAWNDAANWSPATGAPNSPALIAELGASTQTAVTIDAATDLKGLIFNNSATAHTLTVASAQQFTLGTYGLRNLSANIQNVTVEAGGTLVFNGGGILAGNVSLTNQGELIFNQDATAGNATISSSSTTNFFNGTSSAGSATINLLAGGQMDFFGNSTAFNATFNLASASGLFFSDTATAANSTVNLAVGSSLDISSLTTVTGTVLGALNGNGSVFLGGKELIVGLNGASMSFEGVIQDGGVSGGTGGSFTKSGTGSLTLSGANLHTGVTTLNAGTLVLGLNTTLATSTLDIQGGTLSFGTLTDATLGGLSGSQDIALTNSSSAAVALSVGENGEDTSYFGALSGLGSLIKTGTGTLNLSGANTYLGSTTISGGTLHFASGSALSSSSNLVLDGGVAGLPSTFSGNLALGTGAGQVQWTGDGGFAAFGADVSLTLNSGATLSWGVTSGFVADGSTLILGSASADGSLTLTNNLDLGAADRTVRAVNGLSSPASVLSGNLSGTGGLIKTGEGLLSLTGVNTYGGATRVLDGALLLGSGSNISVTSNLQLGGGIALLGVGSPSSFTIGTGAGELQWTGGGGFAAFGANQTVTLNGGTELAWGSTPGFVADGSELAFGSIHGDATLTFTNSINLGAADRTIRVNTGPVEVDAILAGVLSGTGGLVVTGQGTLALTGANTYTGNTSVIGGALEFSSLANLGTGTVITLDGGGLRYAAGTSTDVSTRTLTIGANDGFIDTNGHDVTLANAIGGPGGGGLYKFGTGTLTLTGQGTDLFFASVDQGSLALSGGGTVQSGNLIIGTRSRSSAGFSVSGTGSEWLADLVVIGAESGGDGQATVSNGSYFQADTILIGAGGEGSFTVQSGGLVDTLTTTIGLGADGSLLIDGGTWITDDWSVIGYGATGTLTIQNGGIFHNLDTFTGTEISYLGSSGSVLVTGSGSQFLNDGGLAIGYYGHGEVTVEQGALMKSSSSIVGGTGSGSANVLITTGGTWNLTSDDDPFDNPALEIGTAANASTLTLNQGGQLNLLGSNGFVWVRELGTLNLGTGGGLLAGTVVNDGGINLENTGTITFDAGLENSGSLVKSGAGTAIITGNFESFPGGTNTVLEGTLQLGNGGSVTTVTGDFTVETDATLAFNSSSPVTYGDVISGGGSVSQNGSETLVFTGANTYSGGTSVSSGTLQAGAPDALGTGRITIGPSGTLDLNGFSAGNIVTNQGGTLLNAESFTGEQTLTGTSTFTGTVSGSLTVNNGGVLKGTATFTGSITVASGGTVSPGNSPGLVSAGNTEFGENGAYEFELNSVVANQGVNQDFLAITGTLTISATSLNPFVIKVLSLDPSNASGAVVDFIGLAPGYTWTFAQASVDVVGFDPEAFFVDVGGFLNPSSASSWHVERVGNSLNLVYVPEPSTWAALAGLGALGIAFLRRRR